MGMDRIELKDAIADLRRQIKAAVEQAKGEQLKFTLDSIELELSVVAEDSAEGSAEVGWWIFKASAGASIKDGATHTVKLILKADNVQVSSPTATA
jgi:hypothetical protein